MLNIFDTIANYEIRIATRSSTSDRNDSMRLIENYVAINRLEGLYADEIDMRIYQLAADGKVSTKEYIDLCKEVAYFKASNQEKHE